MHIDNPIDPLKVNTFLVDVEQELLSARSKFPSSECCVAAMSEEAGEVVKAALDGSEEDIYSECVQLAAMAIRVALEGDDSLLHYRYRHGLRTRAVGRRPEAHVPTKVTISKEEMQWTKAEIDAAIEEYSRQPAAPIRRHLPPLANSDKD